MGGQQSVLINVASAENANKANEKKALIVAHNKNTAQLYETIFTKQDYPVDMVTYHQTPKEQKNPTSIIELEKTVTDLLVANEYAVYCVEANLAHSSENNTTNAIPIINGILKKDPKAKIITFTSTSEAAESLLDTYKNVYYVDPRNNNTDRRLKNILNVLEHNDDQDDSESTSSTETPKSADSPAKEQVTSMTSVSTSRISKLRSAFINFLFCYNEDPTDQKEIKFSSISTEKQPNDPKEHKHQEKK